MSKIAISGNASGTATYTIASPAGSTDRVLTLPDEAGTVLTSASSIGTDSITVPYFEAQMSGTQTISSATETTVQYGTENYDSHGWYDTTTYKYTPQIEGLYLFNAVVNFGEEGSSLSHVRVIFNKSGTEYTASQIFLYSGGHLNHLDTFHSSNSRLFYMNGSTDNVKVTAWSLQTARLRGTSSNVGQFSAYLVKAF
jgi:hypothetical protein